MTKPTIVGVARAWHSADFFQDVSKSFEDLGYSFVSRDAPSIWPQTALKATVEEDAQFIRKNVLLPLINEDGKDVVLMMHSYGGVYGSSAVRGLGKSERAKAGKQGGVVALIYVSAITTYVGKSCLDMMGATSERLPPFVTHDKSTGIVKFTGARDVMYHDMPEAEADEWIAKLAPQSLNALDTPVSYSPLGDPFYEGRSGYVVCGSDKLVPIAGQEAYAGLAGIELKVMVQAASHAFWITACQEVVDATIVLSEEIARNQRG